MFEVKVKKLNKLSEKMVGLIGKNQNHAVYFETHFGIHTFFMSYPITVVILNSQNRVVAIKSALPPNRFFFWNPIYSRIIEIPMRLKQDFQIKKGVKLDLSFY